MEACQCSGFYRNRKLATSEYTYSIPGVLKNAIDWAVAPLGGQCLGGQARHRDGCGQGTLGTARAQYPATFWCFESHETL